MTKFATPAANDSPAATPREATFALFAALAATILLFAAIAWAMTTVYQAYARATTRTAALHRHIDELLYLDEALTMTAAMAATTGAPKWRVRYAALVAAQDAQFDELRRHTRSRELATAYFTARRTAAVLGRDEEDAIALAARGDRTTATAALVAPAYSRVTREHRTSLESLRRLTTKEHLVDVAAVQNRNRALLLTLLVLVPLFIFAWLRAIRATRLFVRGKEAAERALLVSDERFHLAARATSELIWDWDIIGERVWFSESLVSHFGYDRSGEYDVDVWYAGIHADDLERIGSSIHEFLDGSCDTWSGEYRFRDGSGTYRDVLDRGFVVRDESGKAIRMTGAILDITARKAAESRLASVLALNEMVLSSVADGIFGLDRDGAATFVNAAAAGILGMQPSDLLGRQMHELVHHSRENGETYPWTECPSFETLRDGSYQQRGDETLWAEDGRSIPVEYTSSPMLDAAGNIAGAVVTFRDVTARRAVERMKAEFVSVVSHELRTPLTSIRGALSLLASGRLGTLEPKGEQLLKIAASNAERLVRLINDILDIERIESNNFTLVKSDCDAVSLARQAVETVRVLAEREQIAIRIDAPADVPLEADGERIVQTLTNLLGNAIKFSAPGSDIRLSIARRDADVLFSVADTGRGIPQADLERIFNRFQQVDASDARDKGGSGLGLAICRTIVRQHGGEIEVSSTVGEGSTFSFYVPTAVKTEIPVPIVSVVEPVPIARRTILVCDDDADTRAVIAEMLLADGYAVREARGGEDLVNQAARSRPDAILLDLLMPDMSGWEALARLKENPLTADVPVIVISVLSADESGTPFAELSGWLEKPIYERELLDAVQRAFGAPSRRPRVVLVEDDQSLAAVVAASFDRLGVETIHVDTARAAMQLSREITPDLLVLDLLLPDIDGFTFVDWLKDSGVWRGVPLVVYSAIETTPSQRDRLRLGPTEFIAKNRVAPEVLERRVLTLLGSMTNRNAGDLSHVA